MSVSLASLMVMGLFCLSMVGTMLLYKKDMSDNAEVLRNIIKELERMVAEREDTISDLHKKVMAKDLTDYRVNTKESSVAEEFVQTEPTEVELEQASDKEFLNAIKEAPVEQTETVSG